MRTRDETLNLMRAMLAEGIIMPQDLARFLPSTDDPVDPEAVRRDWERWYIGLGIELITGRPFNLSACPFTRDEIEQAERAGEVILCVPMGVSRRELGQLFRIHSWALTDPMVSDTAEAEDFWFKTSRAPVPDHLNRSATEIRRLFEDEHKLGFSLERYLVFIARLRFLTSTLPDFRYWIWLLRGRYDRSGMLIAGFDALGNFSVHGWMPKFQASFVGARSAIIPDRIVAQVPVHLAAERAAAT